jgi:hypothetical protein
MAAGSQAKLCMRLRQWTSNAKNTERVYAKQKVKQIRVVALWTDPERLTPNIDTDWPLAWRVTC